MRTAALHLLDLPDDVLLEVLALLPASTIVLCCRLCHKLDRLTRERHLWIELFGRTKDAFLQPINLGQFGTAEFEISVCRAEMLEEKWGDKGTQWDAPRFWRGNFDNGGATYKAPFILGDYVTVDLGSSLDWFSIHDLAGPPVYVFPNTWKGSPMHIHKNSATSTCYAFSQFGFSMKVASMQVGDRGPYITSEFELPLNVEYIQGLTSIHATNGFVIVRNHPLIDGVEVNIIYLEKKTVAWFRVPPLPPPPNLVPPYTRTRPYPEVFVTESHLICTLDYDLFAVFEPPTATSGKEAQPPSTEVGPPSTGIVPMNMILMGGFPWALNHKPHVIPRSASTFVMVVPQNITHKIHIYLFTISGANSKVEEICSVDIPGDLKSFTLPVPPIAAQFAFGIAGVKPTTGTIKTGGNTYFALRIDFPDPERNPAPEGRVRVSWRRMSLAPAIDILEEKFVFCGLDCFSGKAWFMTLSKEGKESHVVLDYLSENRLSTGLQRL